MNKLKAFWELLKNTIQSFNADNALHFSAALSYYTIFSLPPILIIVIALAGIVFGKESVSHQVYDQISSLVGPLGASQVKEMVEKTGATHIGFAAKLVGLITLVLSATGVFVSLQDTLNIIWGVKAKPKSSVLKLLRDRILSFAMVITISFLLLVSLVIHALIVAFSSWINHYFESITVLFIQILNFTLSLIVITFLFALIFKVLPDVKIQWKDVRIGAFVTAVLFSIGKFLIGFYLGHTNVASAYGAAGTIIIILTWVFYSSILLFFGAEFTQAYAKYYGRRIEPSEYAVKVEMNIIDPEKGAVKEKP
jgi:membrane protein